jgi:error-prone DNA polymerase
VELPDMPDWAKMSADYELLGLSPHYHPLGLLRAAGTLPAGLVTTTELEELPDGTPIRLAGLVVCRQRPETAKGITFLLLEDEHGLANAIVSRGLYEAQRLLVRAEPFVILAGRLQRRERTLNVIATGFERLAGAVAAVEAMVEAAAVREIDVVAAPGNGSRDDALRRLAPASHNYR